MPTDPGRFIRGWLTLELSGEHPERLLDLALRQGLALREVQWLEPGRLLAQLDRDDLRQLTALARRCRVRVRVRRQRGARVSQAGAGPGSLKDNVLFSCCFFLSIDVYLRSLIPPQRAPRDPPPEQARV